MNSRYILLMLFILVFGCDASNTVEVTAKLTDIKIIEGSVFVNLKITNSSDEIVFIDQMFLSSDEGVLIHNILRVFKFIEGQKKSFRYKGMYRDYSELHDYNKTEISIMPSKSITRKINVSSNYLIDKSGRYEISYGGIIANKEGSKQNVLSAPLIIEFDCNGLLKTR